MRKILIAAAILLGVAVAALGGWWSAGETETAGPPVSGTVADFTLMEAPRPMPAEPFADENGAAMAFADFEGKVLLVNFWATWCAPCRVEMKALDRLEAALGGADFAVLPISFDLNGAAAVVPFYEEYGLEHLPIALDPTGAIGDGLGIQALPTTIIVDRTGHGVGYLLGPAEWDSPEAEALIRHYIDRAE
ncbi:MAG: TlpA disulfide reductase family protein [Rhodospirillaceae bacterium]|nr:TlpA disulfide reductase family protein [Rhodospirillaceae bacterium]